MRNFAKLSSAQKMLGKLNFPIPTSC